ncbi:formyltetrahydrofolate-dependent phosphoribosylglycinamide formyltransferase [Flavobacterium croceum DSM 17960]|uniref:Phosphoribosylglycinamide formyltransferase n=1 Tax=Flavobacterium croceum DSM 17960 TaxID=1121886 RepID=A0A2S4N6M2_9FLAO|nr:phosphoribosylglycinamide formyltransferase [Flavobacterium croceum]POS00973.1 formyltetrahydrofolate-dependent phosphoribosylglycinamide formyltransferase [Flavobacterium croceum DSM 17960]
MNNLVLFASGSGSNAEKIMQYFKNNEHTRVAAVCSNNPNAKVLERAQKFNIPTFVFSKKQLEEGEVLNLLAPFSPNLLVLAGFLLKIPDNIIQHYPNKIINIHPALLPKYGGKGMYGTNVHKAVWDNKEPETGITIHYVNENYDEGNIIFQKSVAIQNCTSAEMIAHKVLELEHQYFSTVIEQLLKNQE